MTAPELKALVASGTSTTNEKEEEFSIPLDISDIINICREYHKLGWQVQSQVENILEVGIEESIKSGVVIKQSLPLIKSFLLSINQNAYFGDAASQAHDCIELIRQYEEKHSGISTLN
jgi:hypothetical protein